MAVAIVIIMSLVTVGLILLIHSIGRSAGKSQVDQHTKAQYIDKLRAHFGDSGLNLYGAIGDALDQKSSWVRTMDVLFEVFRAHPDLMLEYLIETHGIDAVQEALDKYK